MKIFHGGGKRLNDILAAVWPPSTVTDIPVGVKNGDKTCMGVISYTGDGYRATVSLDGPVL